MSVGAAMLASAREAYRIATDAYYAQRDAGGIVELDRTDNRDNEDWKAGQRWKCVTPAGRMAMGHWQKAKAELDAAAEYAKREGRPVEEPAREYPPDPRLPVERDEEVFAP